MVTQALTVLFRWLFQIYLSYSTRQSCDGNLQLMPPNTSGINWRLIALSNLLVLGFKILWNFWSWCLRLSLGQVCRTALGNLTQEKRNYVFLVCISSNTVWQSCSRGLLKVKESLNLFVRSGVIDGYLQPTKTSEWQNLFQSHA